MISLSEFENKIKSKEEILKVTLKDSISKKNIQYSIHNKKTLWRAQTLFKKEPITIDWIRGFEKGSIFYDVGANVGMYSIFSSIVSEVTVFSFEPESNNFQVLMENIAINNLMNLINPYPIGISNSSTLTNLHITDFKKGSSHHTVGKDALSHHLEPITTPYRQGIFSITLNDLIEVYRLPCPNYLKIDVDGIEFKIIDQSDILLNNNNLRSILIEINSKREVDKNIINKLLSFGFVYNEDQVEDARRKSGPHEGYAEYLFFRK